MTLFAAMSSQPDATRKALINTTILALKSAGIWALLDELWMMAAHDSQAALLGWKRYKNLTAVNAPTFTTDRGYAGNGTTSYLNTGFVPSTHGVNYALNDASAGVYSRTAAQAAIDMGARTSSTVAQLFVNGRNTGDAAAIRLNSDTQDLSNASTDGSGLTVGRRTASNSVDLYRNGSLVKNENDVSSSLPPYAVYIGALNTAGAAGSFSARQYAFGFAGASLSVQQQADLFTITEAYLDAIGAGVV